MSFGSFSPTGHVVRPAHRCEAEKRVNAASQRLGEEDGHTLQIGRILWDFFMRNENHAISPGSNRTGSGQGAREYLELAGQGSEVLVVHTPEMRCKARRSYRDPFGLKIGGKYIRWTLEELRALASIPRSCKPGE